MILKNLFKNFAKKSYNKDVHSSSGRTSHKPTAPVFWLCVLLGSVGAHCFWAGRRTRGMLYLIWGGVAFALVYLIYTANHAILPAWIATLGIVAACLVQLLVIWDLWKITRGKYKRKKSGRHYKSSPWMYPFAVIMTCLTGYALFTASVFIKENVSNRGRPTAIRMEHTVDAYMNAQQSYFKKNGKIGDFNEIGFHPVEKTLREFKYENEGKALKVTYLMSLNCPYKSTWIIEPTVLDSALQWKVALPLNAKCNAMARQLVALDKKMKALADSAAARAAQLDKSVDGVGVVPDSTKQGKSK